MLRRIYFYGLLVLVFALGTIHIFADISGYKLAFEEPEFLMEGVFQILETDLDQDNQAEIVVAGKNYIGRELFIYWLKVDSELKPQIIWQSPNLYEERSVIWTTTGRFFGNQTQLIAVTGSQIYVYQLVNNQLTLIKQFAHKLRPLNISSGDLDGDGTHELIIGEIGRITSKIYDGVVKSFRLNEAGYELIGTSDLLGNIRGLTAGDIDGNGKAEVFIEEGPMTATGNLHMLNWDGTKFFERYRLKEVVKGAAYGLRLKQFPDGMKLLTASSRGKVNLFNWSNGQLQNSTTELSFQFVLVDLDTADLNQDQIPEILVVGYPKQLRILTK